MAKLCRHHQRQVVDAIGFLQTEVKALSSSNTQQTKAASGNQGTTCSTAKSGATVPEKSDSQLKFTTESTLKSEVQDMSLSSPSSCVMKASTTTGPMFDLCSSGLMTNQASVTYPAHSVDRNNEHVPLKMKIMKTSHVAAGKKLACVLTASLSSDSGTLEDRLGNSSSSNRTEIHSARLSSSVKRHNQLSSHQMRQRGALGHAKDVRARPFSLRVTNPTDSPRTARKTVRVSADHHIRDSSCRGLDPDLGHCDIVYIDKPITESFKKRQHTLAPRRNARKSTRGYMYSDEIWELKTVRTLAGRGNCPNPMPELITLVTPKQIMSKPEGLPPVDMPFAGACREAMSEQLSAEESDERVIPGTGDVVEVAASEVDIIVETSQTDQRQSKGPSTPQPLTNSLAESTETDLNTHLQENTTASEQTVAEAPSEAEKENASKPQEQESMEQVVSDTVVEPSVCRGRNDAQPEISSDVIQSNEPALQENSTPSPLNNVQEETQDNERETTEDKQPQPEAQRLSGKGGEAETPNTTSSTGEEVLNKQEIATIESSSSVEPAQREEDEEEEDNYDVSSKTLETLLKELPPWRRKRGTMISLPKRLRKTETVIVGYFNGRPISASDRSLRRRASNSGTTTKSTVKSTLSVLNTTGVSEETIKLEKHESETKIPEKTIVAAPVIPPMTESDATSRPTRSKKTTNRKRSQGTSPVLVDQQMESPHSTTESKRQLRSAGQKPAVTPAPPPPSTPLTSTLSPPPAPPPTAPEQSQLSSVQVTAAFDNKNTQPVSLTAEEEQKGNSEMSQSRQRLRSAKVAVDTSENKQQISSELRPPTNETPANSETQLAQTQKGDKRVLRKEAATPKTNVALSDRVSAGEQGSLSVADKPIRMPLRSESAKTEASPCSVTPSSPLDSKKLTLRSQRSTASSTSTPSEAGRHSDVASPIRVLPEKMTKAPLLPQGVTTKPELPKHPNRFFEMLTGEDHQQLLTNLNIKYDKMQKGWVPMDKEGQPAARHKNRADRQAAIWKSKRRARKPKSLEQQRYSPVQMLFMKGFDLSSICRWFLESTETKSLVIVKKVNTRLPSETQLCFHSSSSASGTSQGMFPSLQAERLKKHLKKFAIASPVKSNAKSLKLIAKALEQEASAFKGKDRRELASFTRIVTKSNSPTDAHAHPGESQNVTGKSRNPASARILRKYSNIREKMQVQQTKSRLKDGRKTLKRLTTAKSASRTNVKASLKAQKSALRAGKQMKLAAKMDRGRTLAGKKTTKTPVVKAPSRAAAKKEELAKRGSQRLSSPRGSEHNPVDTSTAAPESKRVENAAETQQQSVDVKAETLPDQVLTRSQRKMEAAVPLTGDVSQRAAKLLAVQQVSLKSARKAEEATPTRKGALNLPAKKSQATMFPRGTKSATRRAQENSVTPAKRTRTSHSK